MCSDVNCKHKQRAHHRPIHCGLKFGVLGARLDDYLRLWLWSKQECRCGRCDCIACVDLLHRLWLWYWVISRKLISLPPLISAILLAKDSEFHHRLVNDFRLDMNCVMMSMDFAPNAHHAAFINCSVR